VKAALRREHAENFVCSFLRLAEGDAKAIPRVDRHDGQR
jgi:hypothetical protein